MIAKRHSPASTAADPSPPRATVSAWAKLWALLRLRCPRCCRGRLFRGWFEMNDPCPVCGLVFQREEGYFLGAMYVSYFLATVLMTAAYFLATWLFPDWNQYAVIAGVILLYLPLTPVAFRYSRTIWIYYERWGGLTDVPAGPYEKTRARQEDGRPPG